MRRAVGPGWPALSHYFGVHPWDVERMTYAEVGWYRDALADLAKQHRQQARAARRPKRPRRR